MFVNPQLLLGKLVFVIFNLLIFGINENRAAYTPPQAFVQPLHPIGLRISIPDHEGITLVAFHVKFNEEFFGLEAGTIARDIVKVRNGRWTYEDRTTDLKKDDIIYYWIHVVYNGLGYNLLDQEHRVKDFYKYDGTLEKPSSVAEQTCTTASITTVESNGERKSTCPQQLIFQDDFDSLNATRWTVMEKFSGPPDYEFVIYRNSAENVDVIRGKLAITPVLVDEKFGPGFTLHGGINLEGCTGVIGSNECSRKVTGSFILPPVLSGRLTTKNSFAFQYGRIEVRAKLPKGDWLYPLISLESTSNTGQENDAYCQIRIASSPGNVNLRSTDGANVGGNILWAGGLLSLPPSMGQSIYNNRSSLPRRKSNTLWSNDFNTYEIVWGVDRISMRVNGVEYGYQDVRAPFDKPFYINIGLAAGGYGEFQDMCRSGDYEKPWRNVGARAVFDFYGARDKWTPTWSEDSKLQIDYIKVWAL